jgi:3-deoxy-D-arabino-heptulosonate 7-phosphate (DAHP) synthase
MIAPLKVLRKGSVNITLIVEVHPAPEKAISDGAQSLDFPQFQKMMKDLQSYVHLWNESRKREVAAVAV